MSSLPAISKLHGPKRKSPQVIIIDNSQTRVTHCTNFSYIITKHSINLKTVTMMFYALKTLTTLDTCVTEELSIKFRTRMGMLNNHAIVFYWQRLLFLFHGALKCCLKLCSHVRYFSKSWPYNTQFKRFYYPPKHLLVKFESL